MRSMKLVVLAALSLFALAGCNNGQPRIYRVAVDDTQIRGIANPSCYVGGRLPTDRGQDQYQNYRSETEWVIWQGVDQAEYLDLGEASWTLGDAFPVENYGLIEGKDRAFQALRSWQKPNNNDYLYSYQTTIAVTWDDYSFSPKGNVALTSVFACSRQNADCPQQPPHTSCSAGFSFVARRIEAEASTGYNNNPSTPAPEQP